MLQKADRFFDTCNRRLRLSRRGISILLVVILVLCLLPSLYVARYITPQADDYGFSAPTHNVWVETHSFAAVLRAAADATVSLYREWQGSYTACYLMFIQPGLFGDFWYKLVPYFLIGTWLLTTAYVCRKLGGWLGAQKHDAVILTCALLLLQFLLLPYPNESWYWFNGAIYYTFFYTLTLWLLGLLLQSRLCCKRGALLLYGTAFVLLGAFIGGGPFSVILVLLFLMGTATVVSFFKKLPCRFAQLAGLLALCASFAVNALCPGNAFRAEQFPDTPNALHTVYLAIVNASTYLLRWSNLIVALALLLLMPVLYRLAGSAPFSFCRPLAASVLSFGLFAMMLCPPIYGMGSTGPQRLTNVIFFCYLWLVLFNAFYWLGWVRKRTAWGSGTANGAKQFFTQYAAALFLCSAFVCAVAFTVGLYRENTPVSALKIALNGEAETYYSELTARTALYEDDSIRDVVVTELTVKPFPIYHDDLSNDPSYFANGDVALYYGKSSVRLEHNS